MRFIHLHPTWPPSAQDKQKPGSADLTTPLTIKSNCLPMLCALCLSIFRERLEEFEWPDGLAHIRKASEAGCKICYGLMESASGHPGVEHFAGTLVPRDPGRFTMGIFALSKHRELLFSLSQFHLVPNESAQSPEGYPEYVRRASLDLESKPWHVRPDRFRKPIPRNTGHPRVTNIALEWLESCFSSHKTCPPHQYPSTYPERLIDVTGRRPRLIVTKEKPLNDNYATLSHCWGKDPRFFTLTQSGLDSLKHGLPLRKLPQTFQDAITLVRRLKIPYLWIDSLCIVQDNSQDWLEHAQKMASIYEGCVLNIAVDHASSPLAGIFKERDTDRVQECRMLWAPPPEARETVWTIFDVRNDLFNSHQLPLHTRAWAFQERLLAPRVLHFGTNAIFWECKTSPCSCDAAPTDDGSWSPSETPFSIVPDPPMQSTIMSIAKYHCDLRQLFYSLVQRYSGLKLTKPDEDKLVAFAGIAKRIGSIDYYNHQYFAGFFRKDLPIDLVWLNTGSDMTKRNPEIYRAPTWSWASLDSSVLPFPWHQRTLMSDLVMLAEVRSISVSHVDPSNQYGQIKSAQLVLLGSLIPCRIGAITMKHNLFFNAYLQDEAEPSNVIGEFRPDMREDASYEGLKFACPIVECHWMDSQDIRGIVVQTTEDGMFYERLGCFTSDFYEFEGAEDFHQIIYSAKKQVAAIV